MGRLNMLVSGYRSNTVFFWPSKLDFGPIWHKIWPNDAKRHLYNKEKSFKDNRNANNNNNNKSDWSHAISPHHQWPHNHQQYCTARPVRPLPDLYALVIDRLTEGQCHCIKPRRHFWHATVKLRSAIRRHHPPQRAVLSQVCCFEERKVVLFQILLDGAEPRDVGTT